MNEKSVLFRVAALSLLTGALAGCSSPGHTGSAASVKAACETLSAVLSDGPDPSTDPLGYAEAQVLPLEKIHTADSALRVAIADLAHAYHRFYETNGGSAAKQAVRRATARVNSVCPGAVT